MSVSASLIAASAALRAASLDLCSDEYLLLLAKPTEIASLSRLAHDPADSVQWRKARGIPANRGRIEDLIGARATLLVTMGGGAKSKRPPRASAGKDRLMICHSTCSTSRQASVVAWSFSPESPPFGPRRGCRI